MDYLEFIDINEIRKGISDQYKLLSQIETDSKIENILSKGVLFKNTEIKVIIQNYHNHLAGRMCYWYYLVCPVCNARCRKIYVTEGNKLACRKCSKIKAKFKPNSQADRVLRIQMYLNELFDRNITAKRRKQLIKNITIHYQQLDSTYKMIYNTIAFKELQKWCLEASHDKNKSADYKKATSDMLKKLRDIRKVLVSSGLSISKNDKLEI
jgi:hypothetical protein